MFELNYFQENISEQNKNNSQSVRQKYGLYTNYERLEIILNSSVIYYVYHNI